MELANIHSLLTHIVLNCHKNLWGWLRHEFTPHRGKHSFMRLMSTARVTPPRSQPGLNLCPGPAAMSTHFPSFLCVALQLFQFQKHKSEDQPMQFLHQHLKEWINLSSPITFLLPKENEVPHRETDGALIRQDICPKSHFKTLCVICIYFCTRRVWIAKTISKWGKHT